MGFRCLRQRRARRGSPAAPGGVLLGAMYLRVPGYGVTGFGAAGGTRTRGLLFPKQVRFQLRYSDMERAEAVNFFRASAMAMADKHPFASGCPHEKGPRSVVGACPSAGPLPGDLPASGRGVFSGGPWQPKKKPPAGIVSPPAAFTNTGYHARNVTFNDILQIQPVHRLVMQPEHLPQHQVMGGGDLLPPLS